MVHGGNIGGGIRPDPANGPAPVTHLLAPSLNVLGLDGHVARYAVSAAIAAVLAGGLLHLLVPSTPGRSRSSPGSPC